MTSKIFCDIIGTITDGENREIALKKFINNINELDDSKSISFSFISSEEMPFVVEFVDELKKHIPNTKIVLGNQYSSNKVLNNNHIQEVVSGKLSQILNELDDSKYDVVYYFDDCVFTQLMTKKIIETKYPDLSFVQLIPGKVVESSIDGLNLLIEDYANNKNIKHNKHQKEF